MTVEYLPEQPPWSVLSEQAWSQVSVMQELKDAILQRAAFMVGDYPATPVPYDLEESHFMDFFVAPSTLSFSIPLLLDGGAIPANGLKYAAENVRASGPWVAGTPEEADTPVLDREDPAIWYEFVVKLREFIDAMNAIDV